MYTIGIGFMGVFRPAYFQAETVKEAASKAIAASRGMVEADKITAWIQQCARNVRPQHCPYSAIEHGSLSVSIRRAPHDPFLDSVTRGMPQCPGLDYSQCAN
jgi:hypothetical protein